jgi:hypothetical protein
MIMDSVIKNDTRAVQLCAWWLREGTFDETQSRALRYALALFTEEDFGTDEEWISWYYGGGQGVSGQGEILYPEPDFEQWLKEK